MGKQLQEWLEEFVQNGAKTSRISNWPDEAQGNGGGVEKVISVNSIEDIDASFIQENKEDLLSTSKILVGNNLIYHKYVNKKIYGFKLSAKLPAQFVDINEGLLRFINININGDIDWIEIDTVENKHKNGHLKHVEYYSGDGIQINNGRISVNDTVARKEDLFSGDYNDLSNKPTIPSIENSYFYLKKGFGDTYTDEYFLLSNEEAYRNHPRTKFKIVLKDYNRYRPSNMSEYNEGETTLSWNYISLYGDKKSTFINRGGLSIHNTFGFNDDFRWLEFGGSAYDSQNGPMLYYTGGYTLYPFKIVIRSWDKRDDSNSGYGAYIFPIVTEEKTIATTADINLKVPDAPTSDGTYQLEVTVSNGTPTYQWVLKS